MLLPVPKHIKKTQWQCLIFDQRFCWVPMAQGACNDSEAWCHRCSAIHWGFPNVWMLTMIAGWWWLIILFPKHLSEEADVVSCAKLFSRYLCKQRQLLVCSFPLSRHFSSWHVNKTITTDFKTCRRQCTL